MMANRNMQRFYGALFMFVFFLLVTGCTKHHADNITAAGGHKSTATLMDSVVGSWHVIKVELPELQAKLSSFTSQAEKDDMSKKMEIYQSGLINLSTILKADGTYESNLNGQVDLGTWTVSDKREVNTISKMTNRSSVYELVRVTGDELTVRHAVSDAVLLLTFSRK